MYVTIQVPYSNGSRQLQNALGTRSLSVTETLNCKVHRYPQGINMVKYNENLYKLVPGSLGAEGRGESVTLLRILNGTERYMYIYPKKQAISCIPTCSLLYLLTSVLC